MDQFTIRVIDENESVLILEKPAGMPVFSRTSKVINEGTVAHWLIQNYSQQKNLSPVGEAGIVHRLDNDTSGLLMVARSQNTYDYWRALWNTPQVKKEYIALVLGNIKPKINMTSAIAHHPSRKNSMVVCETKKKADELKAREAKTHVLRKAVYCDHQGNTYSLVSVIIQTGVRHQIRVHLASQGYPLVGDKLYQNALKRKKDTSGTKRHFLHLSKMSLSDPVTGKRMEWISKLPEDWEILLSRFSLLS